MSGDWRAIETRAEFCRLLADNRLQSGELSFVIHSDGRISGISAGAPFSGSWRWEGTLFCRRLVGVPDKYEQIEISGPLMRYRDAGGQGDWTIVHIVGRA